MGADHNALILLSALRMKTGPNGGVVLTRKFIDGVGQYVRQWPGPVVVLAERNPAPTGNLDEVEVPSSQLPFQIQPITWDGPDLSGWLRKARVVLCALDDWRQIPVPALCAAVGVPAVCVTEYTVKTRRQIICSETRNPLLRLRRIVWTARQERRRRRAVRLAAGLQCNGTPTFREYQPLNPRSLLFFDSRVEPGLLAAPSILDARARPLLGGQPLRLAFSGRLVAMKGARHLPQVARQLRELNVPFTFDIFGDGDMAPALRDAVAELGLTDRVHLRGVLDFARELLPRLAQSIDLFVCCHPQGDPACTYLETMACGVPIAGYDNEAFRGVVEVSNVGWTSPLNDPAALARLICRLNQDRPALAQAARRARDFAARNTFDQVFRQRITHLRECSSPEGSTA